MAPRGCLQVLPVAAALLLLLVVALHAVLAAPTYVSLADYRLVRDPATHAVDKRRGNMDLAFMQMYALCDRNRDGDFSPRELHCLRDTLRLLIGTRNNYK